MDELSRKAMQQALSVIEADGLRSDPGSAGAGRILKAAADLRAALAAPPDPPAIAATLRALHDRLTECAALPCSAAEAYDSYYREMVEDVLAGAAPAPLAAAPAATFPVWEVYNKVSSLLFATKEAAERTASSATATVGMRVSERFVIGAAPAAPAAPPTDGPITLGQAREWDRARAAAVPAPVLAPTLTERLQQRCSDWGTYWRAQDAHGVELTHEQALELLRDALGVEVDWRAAAPVGVEPPADIQGVAPAAPGSTLQPLVAASAAISNAGQEAGLSWSGFNVYGDAASIKAVADAVHDAGTVPELKNRIRDAEYRATRAADDVRGEKTMHLNFVLDLQRVLQDEPTINGFSEIEEVREAIRAARGIEADARRAGAQSPVGEADAPNTSGTSSSTPKGSEGEAA